MSPVNPHGFPALAGIGPLRISTARRRCWLPRARGDRPALTEQEADVFAASPRSRGSARGSRCTPDPERGFPALAGIGPHGGGSWSREQGFPALAGIGPSASRSGPGTARLPRARGDRPAEGEWLIRWFAASPRSRGSARCGARHGDNCSGFPALAGIGPRGSRCCSPRARLPRARGDRPRSLQHGQTTSGASPRSRGSARGRAA